MSQEKIFIKTTDKETANKLAFAGFHLVSQNNNIYTFLNQPPKNFCFDEADVAKLAYTNILSM